MSIMTGRQIESRGTFPVFATLWLLGALGLGIAAAAEANPHFLVGALFPLGLSFALLFTRPRPFSGRFAEDALEVDRPQATLIPYAYLQGVWGQGRPARVTEYGPLSYPIQILHDEGVLDIPARLNVSSDHVYQFLYKHFPPLENRAVNPLLAEYLEEQEGSFGTDRVFFYQARSHLGTRGTLPRARAVCLALTAVAIAWMIAGGAMLAWEKKAAETWLGLGILFILFGLLVFVLFRSSAKRTLNVVKGWKRAGLVVSPTGMAIVQGPVQGMMRWDELRGVNFRGATSSFAVTSEGGLAGITLAFEAAKVRILDVYDRPLRDIYNRICDYWGD
jgi:hypothetical protein